MEHKLRQELPRWISLRRVACVDILIWATSQIFALEKYIGLYSTIPL